MKNEELLLVEWKEALATERHFDDLLIRFRSIALPLLVAVATLGPSVFDVTFKAPLWFSIVIANGILLSALMMNGVAWRQHDSPEDPPTARAHILELWAYAAFMLPPAVVIVALPSRWLLDDSAPSQTNIPIAVPIVLVTVVLVLLVYLLDRYYYYPLLIGAVRRATALEDDDKLPFQLTHTISRAASNTSSRVLITALYVVPTLVGFTGAATLVIVGAGSPP